MSLYSQYIAELQGRGMVESDYGFVTYEIHGEECYIQEIYIVPEHRKTKLASELADQVTSIAVTKGCKFLTGTVIPSANNSTISLKVLLGYGFQLLKSEPDKIWFIKELV